MGKGALHLGLDSLPHTKSTGAATDGTTFGECFLDVVCTKYSGTSAGLTIYEDSLRTNIIGEFSLKDFLKENQVRSPVVRTEYAEVQEIDRVSYRSMPILQRSIRSGYQ